MARPNRSDQRTHSTAEIAHSTLHSPTPNPSNRDAMHGCQLQRGTPNVPQSPHQTIAESCGSTRPAPDLTDRAQENPPSNARATGTGGSNRIPEHSPKKLNKKSHRSRTSRTTNAKHKEIKRDSTRDLISREKGWADRQP